jgi:DNA-binding Xre family transcriptional regulator
MEMVARLEKVMISKGWNKAELTRRSGVSSAIVTRFFQHGKIKSIGLFKILNALDLIPMTDSGEQNTKCDLNCDAKMHANCEKIRLLFDTQWGKRLENDIAAYMQDYQEDQKKDEIIESLRREIIELKKDEPKESSASAKRERRITKKKAM